MITAEQAVDLDQRPSVKKRLLVAGLLAMAAIGTHWLPGRALAPLADEARAGGAGAVTAAAVVGPNSLLGDGNIDSSAARLAPPDACVAHLDADSYFDQSGLNRTLANVSGNQDAGFEAEVAAAGSAGGELSAAGSTSVSPVPEPSTAGLLVLFAVPILARRKAR